MEGVNHGIVKIQRQRGISSIIDRERTQSCQEIRVSACLSPVLSIAPPSQTFYNTPQQYVKSFK